MILQELVRYYERKAGSMDPAERLPAFGLEEREIPFVIELEPDGSVRSLIDTRTGDGPKRRAQSFLVPIGEKRASGIRANLLWDNAEYVLGVGGDRKATASPAPSEAFRGRIRSLPDDLQADAGIRAVLAFLERGDFRKLQARPEWDEIVESRPLVTFRLAGASDLICQTPAVLRAFVESPAADGAVEGICLVTGEQGVVQRLHHSIKGVWGAQSSGASVVSFNAQAFESYGKGGRQGENAPIGEKAAFAYATALNHLLARDSRNRVQVGDSSTVIWADRPSRFDSEHPIAAMLGGARDDPDRGVRAVRALFESMASGVPPADEAGVRFFVLGLAPNAARVSVRFWLSATFAELAPRMVNHFTDLRVVRRFDHDSPAPSLFRLLAALAVQGKVDNAPPRLGGEWMRAILEGRPYPALLLNAAVVRCKAERDVSYLRAAVLKAWLNREHRRQNPAIPDSFQYFKEALDMEQQNVPYRLGRLFALLERIQQQAMPGINATIRDRYYGAASTTPVAVFTTLLRLKNAHLKKLSDGGATYFERQIGEVLAGIEEFPRQMALADQGRFALGYYHQRQAFFTRKDAADPDAQQEE